MAILKFKTDQLGKGMDFRGIHHFGVLVEDVDEFSKKLESLGAEPLHRPGPGRTPGRLFREEILRAGGVLFDIAEHGWAGAEPLPVPTKAAAE